MTNDDGSEDLRWRPGRASVFSGDAISQFLRVYDGDGAVHTLVLGVLDSVLGPEEAARLFRRAIASGCRYVVIYGTESEALETVFDDCRDRFLTERARDDEIISVSFHSREESWEDVLVFASAAIPSEWKGDGAPPLIVMLFGSGTACARAQAEMESTLRAYWAV